MSEVYLYYVIEKVNRRDWQHIHTGTEKIATRQWVAEQGKPVWILERRAEYDSKMVGGFLEREFAAFWHPLQPDDGIVYGFMQGGKLLKMEGESK